MIERRWIGLDWIIYSEGEKGRSGIVDRYLGFACVFVCAFLLSFFWGCEITFHNLIIFR